MRMFRKNILWIAIGNRNGLLLISKKSFSKGLTDLPPQHLMLNACRMALRLFCLPLAAVGRKAQPPSGIKGYNYQHIGDENVDSVRVTGLSHRVPDGYPAATS